MKPGVTCQKLVSLNKISPVTEKTNLFQILMCLKFEVSNTIMSRFIDINVTKRQQI